MPPLTVQVNRYACGTHSVMCAITALGGVAEYDVVYKAIGTTVRAGTNEIGIIDGLRELGYSGREYETKNPELAWRYLRRNCHRFPIILSVDKFLHWICTTGRVDRMVSVFDPDPHRNESGAIIYHKKEILERWIGVRGVYYAIRVSR